MALLRTTKRFSACIFTLKVTKQNLAWIVAMSNTSYFSACLCLSACPVAHFVITLEIYYNMEINLFYQALLKSNSENLSVTVFTHQAD